jgi:hypothetical protein
MSSLHTYYTALFVALGSIDLRRFALWQIFCVGVTQKIGMHSNDDEVLYILALFTRTGLIAHLPLASLKDLSTEKRRKKKRQEV